MCTKLSDAKTSVLGQFVVQSNLDQKEVDIFNLTDNSWRGDLEFVKTLLLQMVSDDTDIVWNLQGLFLPWFTYLL